MGRGFVASLILALAGPERSDRSNDQLVIGHFAVVDVVAGRTRAHVPEVARC